MGALYSPSGKPIPITNWEGSWAATVNEPTPERVKAAFRNQHAATSDQRRIYPLPKGWKPHRPDLTPSVSADT